MLVLTFDDGERAPKVPLGVVKTLKDIGWQQTGIADSVAIGQVCFDGSCDTMEAAQRAILEWQVSLRRTATLQQEDDLSETSSLTKPDVKTDDVVGGVVLKRQIGRGQFSTVWSGAFNDAACAVKLFTTNEEYAEIVQREVRAMEVIGEHGNIVHMLKHGHDNNIGCGYIVYERMTCDMFIAMQQRGAMPVSTALRAFASILRALEHIHAKNIAHADVKPENVLVDAQGRICLGDFGGCLRIDDKGMCSDDDTMHVTTEYRAPEVILDDEYNVKSDIWSAACVLYEICTTEPLFPAEDVSDVSDVSDENDETKDDAVDDQTKDHAVDDETKDHDETKDNTETKDHTDECKEDSKEETQNYKGGALIKIDIPVCIDDQSDQRDNLHIDEDSDSSGSDFNINEAMDELTEHQKKVTQLACMVRVLGPVPKTMAKKYNDLFTNDGRVQGYTEDQNESLQQLLHEANINSRDIAIISSLLTKLLTFQPTKRPSASEVLQMRAMKEF